MTLFARVRKVTGLTEHLGEFVSGPPARAELIEDESGFFLLRYTAEEKFAGDTWHATRDDAQRQALAELAILPGDWSSVGPSPLTKGEGEP